MHRKTIIRRTVLVAIAGAAMSALLPAAASAQATYPERDVTLVIPFGAGGGSDVLARTIANVIQTMDLLPVNLLVENRTGGSGAIGYKYIADQKDDPHTIGTVSVSFFTTPLLGASPVNYENFKPVAAIAMSPYILTVRAESDIQTVADFAKAERRTTGAVGTVSDPALLSQMAENELGLNIDVVPFDGEGEVVSALLGGHIDFMFGNPGEILPQIEAGVLRPIGVSTAERLQSLPDVPTFKELGYGIEHVQLRGVIMPPDVPDEAVAYWEDLLRKVAESEEWKTQYLDRFKDEARFVGSEEFGAVLKQTNDLYRTMMTELKLIQ